MRDELDEAEQQQEGAAGGGGGGGLGACAVDAAELARKFPSFRFEVAGPATALLSCFTKGYSGKSVRASIYVDVDAARGRRCGGDEAPRPPPPPAAAEGGAAEGGTAEARFRRLTGAERLRRLHPTELLRLHGCAPPAPHAMSTSLLRRGARH
jgi:hypothetical protein